MNNLSNEDTQLINILNTMYTDNNNQIQNLTASNNQIRTALTTILTSSRRHTNRQNNNRYNNLFNNLIHATNTSQGRNSTSSTRNLLSDNLSFSLFQSFFEPVEIYPTQTQIEIATRRVRYSDIISPPNVSCPISLELFNDSDMVTVIRQCGHIFDSDQLNTWFRSNCKCPVCRYDIRNYNTYDIRNYNTINTENTNNQQQNSSSQNNEERNNENSIQSYLNLFLDASGNLILDSTDPNVFLNLLTNLQNRRQT
jgi:hypothetical protein